MEQVVSFLSEDSMRKYFKVVVNQCAPYNIINIAFLFSLLTSQLLSMLFCDLLGFLDFFSFSSQLTP
jgi:hypothetical protein